MGRKPRVDRSPEEKWQIVQEGIKSGNVSETCRRHGIAASLFYRWRGEAEQGAKGSAWGGKRCRGAALRRSECIDAAPASAPMRVANPMRSNRVWRVLSCPP